MRRLYNPLQITLLVGESQQKSHQILHPVAPFFLIQFLQRARLVFGVESQPHEIFFVPDTAQAALHLHCPRRGAEAEMTLTSVMSRSQTFTGLLLGLQTHPATARVLTFEIFSPKLSWS